LTDELSYDKCGMASRYRLALAERRCHFSVFLSSLILIYVYSIAIQSVPITEK